MKTVWKLTDSLGQTYGRTQWGPGVAHRATTKGNTLCTSQLIHYYDSPELAVLMNPCHAMFDNPNLWKAQIQKVAGSDGVKGGAKWLRTLEQVPLPEISTIQRVRFAILCAKEVYHKPSWVAWADNWLDGKGTLHDAAALANYAATNAVDVAHAADTRYVPIHAAYAAYAAAYAAKAAGYAAEYAAAPDYIAAARYPSVDYSAAAAADYAALTAAPKIDFISLASRSVNWE